MSDKPMLYAAVYDEIADAEADYDAVFDLSKGISRGDLKDLGDELQAGTAAVIVLGESKIEEQLEKALARSNKLIEKQVDADADDSSARSRRRQIGRRG